MRTIPPRQRATLARRIAAGLPVWVAARGSNLPAEEVGELMWENEFRELIGAWAEILAMDPAARSRRLQTLAQMVLEEALAEGDRKVALFMQREYHRRRDPVVSLAEGFSALVEQEQAKADRRREALEAKEAARRAKGAGETPAVPSTAEPGRVAATLADAEAARRIPPAAHPDDRAIWRKAGELRRGMLAEQVLHHAVVRKAEHERLMGPPSAVHLPDATGEDDPAFPPELEPPPEAPETSRLNRVQRRRERKLRQASRGKLRPQEP